MAKLDNISLIYNKN